MTERQGHGFKAEEFLEEKLPSFERDSNYTAAHDGTITSSSDKKVPCSIKTVGRGEICLGDFRRIANDDQPLVVIVGEYSKKLPGGKAIFDDFQVCLLPKGFAGVFGKRVFPVRSYIGEYRDYMSGKLASYAGYAYNPSKYPFNSHAADADWTKDKETFDKRYLALYGGEEPLIEPRPKRDHKTQRRLQCAITRAQRDAFYKAYRIAQIKSADFDDPEAWAAIEQTIFDAIDQL